MNWEDPIVKEVREIRAQLSAEHGNDLHALCKYLQERERHESRRIVTRSPRRPDTQSATGVHEDVTDYGVE
jgi:bisphosphoglycerate-dependent phosphoglycerate mutase